ncbi:MAG TPA: polya polymerase, partial [Thermoanaerobaculia bacterium]|nr:polya polymerase [Thermoanaerobaculia bacterium]
TVDIATARSEFYRAPAALPEVRTSALRQDLYRRDFTINTLAIHLGPEEGYELIDYFGGQRDLKEGVLRVLHSLSFLDDPTRVLRAVRLAQRLDFAIAPETLRLIEVALGEGVFDRLSGSRLRDELRLLLDEPDTGVRALERLDELGVLQALHPDLRLTPSRLHDLRQARASWEWYRLEGLDDPPVRLWMLLLASLAAELPPWERGRLAARLHLPQRDQELLRGVGERLRQAESLLVGPGPRPHQVRAALAPLSGEETLLLMAGGGERVRAWVRRDLVELRRVELVVRGADQLAGGCPPGPWVGAALRATLAARLDGEIGPQDELAYALRVCRQEQERQRPSETTGGGEGP